MNDIILELLARLLTEQKGVEVCITKVSDLS